VSVDPKSVLVFAGAYIAFFLFCRYVVFRRPVTSLDVKIGSIWFLLIAALTYAAWLHVTGQS